MKRITLEQYQKSKRICDMYELQILEVTDPRPLDGYEIDLTVRTINGLWGMGFRTVGDVRRHYDLNGGNSFYRIRNIGRKSIEEIRLLLNIPYEVFHGKKFYN